MEWVNIREFVQNLKQTLEQLPVAVGIEPETGTLLMATPSKAGTNTEVQSFPVEGAEQQQRPPVVFALKESGFFTEPEATPAVQPVSQEGEPAAAAEVQKDPGKVSSPVVRVQIHQPVTTEGRMNVSTVFEAYPEEPAANMPNAPKLVSLQPAPASSTGVMLEQFFQSLNGTEQRDAQPVWQSVLLQSSQSSDLTVKQESAAPRFFQSSGASVEQPVQPVIQPNGVSGFSPIASMNSTADQNLSQGFVQSTGDGVWNFTLPVQVQFSPADQFSGQVSEFPAEQQQSQLNGVWPTRTVDVQGQSSGAQDIPIENKQSSNMSAQSELLKPSEGSPAPGIIIPRPVGTGAQVSVQSSAMGTGVEAGNSGMVSGPETAVDSPAAVTLVSAMKQDSPDTPSQPQPVQAETTQQQAPQAPLKVTMQPVEIVLKPAPAEVPIAVGKPVSGSNAFVAGKNDGSLVQQPVVAEQIPLNSGETPLDAQSLQGEVVIRKSTLTFEQGMDFERIRPVLIRPGGESVAKPGNEKAGSPVFESNLVSPPVTSSTLSKAEVVQPVVQWSPEPSVFHSTADGPELKPQPILAAENHAVNTSGPMKTAGEGMPFQVSTALSQVSSEPISQQPESSQPVQQAVEQTQSGQDVGMQESLRRELLYPEQDQVRTVGRERPVPESTIPETVSPSHSTQPSTAVKAPESAGVSMTNSPDKPQQPLPPNPVEQLVQTVRTGMLEGRGQMEMQLVPDELGRLRIRISVEDGRVTARIVTESREARAMLESHLPDLRLALGEQGLKVHEVKLSQAGSSVGDELTGGSSSSFGKERQNFANPERQPASDSWSGKPSNPAPVEETRAGMSAVAMDRGTAKVMAGHIDFRA